MKDFLGQHVNLAHARKIGEGTFGEAFKADSIVIKIVPMEGTALVGQSCSLLTVPSYGLLIWAGILQVNGEVQKRAEEMVAEAMVTLALSHLRASSAAKKPSGTPPGQKAEPENVTSGFVETFAIGICRGEYAPQLVKEWHRWDKYFTSENDDVDMFDSQQLFMVIILFCSICFTWQCADGFVTGTPFLPLLQVFVVADGGLDLEHFELQSYNELKSILLQVGLLKCYPFLNRFLPLGFEMSVIQ